MAHETTYHVFPTDCDVFGHVNHATMITLLEHARWALIEPHISLATLTSGDVWAVVRHVDIGYTAQSLPGDDLIIRSGLLSLGRTSYTIRQTVRKAGSGVSVAQGLMTLVFGFLGLMVAVPLTAAILVPIKMLYVRDVVGDDMPLMSNGDEDDGDDDDD